MGQVLQNPYYGDLRFYHPDGQLMFITSDRRARFYLEKGLAVQDPDDPNRFTLTITPEGYGFFNDALHDYHLHPKINQCVVCASDRDLTKHHVLPVIFQRFYPNEKGDAGVRSHDLLLLCRGCHNRYEAEYADPARFELGEETGALRDDEVEFDAELGKAIQYAKSLHKHGEKLPDDVRNLFVGTIREGLGRQPTSDDIARLCALTLADTSSVVRKADLGEKVTAAWDLGDLRRWWRRHFVESMTPQFLPEGWSVDAPVEAQFRKEP